MDRGASIETVTSTTDEENNLRTTCDGCTIGKIKCDGGQPCKRCLRRGSECIYREKKRCGPKRRKSSTRDDSDEDGSNSGAGSTGYLGEGGGSYSRVLTPKEQEYLAKFYNSANKFIPLTCITVIRDAMNPLQLDVVPGVSPSEAEKTIYHARKAVLLGCVAVGAIFCGDQGSAGAYMQRAQMHLKDCFDALMPEVVSCYLVMVVYHLHFLDRVKVYRYIGFAQQAYRELVQSQPLVAQASGAYVKDSMRFLSTFLHVACSNVIPVEEIDLHSEANPEPGGGSLSRVIALYSNILLQIYRKSNPEVAARAGPSRSPMPRMAALAAMANEADVLLSMMEDPGSFAIVLIKSLRGYFLLMNGPHTEQEVLETVALPVAKALEVDTGVLHFPMTFVMLEAVYAFLLRKGHSAADGMNDAIQAVRPTLAFAGLGCGLALKVFKLFAGEGSPVPAPGGKGLFPAGATPGCGPSPASASEDRDRLGNSFHDQSGDRSSGGGGFAVPAPVPASTAGRSSHQQHFHHGQQQQQEPHHHHHHHHHQHLDRQMSGGSADGMMGGGAGRSEARPQGGVQGGVAGALWPTRAVQGSAPNSAWGERRAPSFNSQGDVPGMSTGTGAAAGGGSDMPLYGLPYPSRSGSEATATSMGLGGEQQSALAFDLAGGADSFFGLKTEAAAMAERSNSADGSGAASGREGGQGRGESEHSQPANQQQHEQASQNNEHFMGGMI